MVILDMKMPGLHGMEILSRLVSRSRKPPVIVCSAYDQMKDEFVVQTYPRLRFFVKPVSTDQLLATVQELLGEADKT